MTTIVRSFEYLGDQGVVAMAQELTEKQKGTLQHVRAYWRRHNVAPSVSDIARSLGITKATAHFHLKALKRKGALVHEPGKGRSWIPQNLVGREVDQHIPLLGRVPAGEPSLAFEDAERHIPVVTNHDEEELFALRVKGVSMIEAGILDGDIAIIRQQDFADDGDIVLVLIDEEEATIKYLQHAGDVVRLVPANNTLVPIEVKAERVRVLGRVIGSQRSYE